MTTLAGLEAFKQRMVWRLPWISSQGSDFSEEGPVRRRVQLLDLAPKGRDEDALAFTMAWVRHHDRY
jgi:predicted dithiol-disulfide oxidoreductase (DUF899 family)